MGRSKKNVVVEPNSFVVNAHDFYKLLDALREGKSLVDLSRDILPSSMEIVNKEVYEALIDEHNKLQQSYHDTKAELEGLKPMYDDYKQEAIILGDQVKILKEANHAYAKRITDAETELLEANQRIASQTNELLKMVQAEEDKPVPSVPVVSVKVEHKVSENTTITLGHTEPLGDRSMTTAHEEVYLKVLSSLDNLIELSK